MCRIRCKNYEEEYGNYLKKAANQGRYALSVNKKLVNRHYMLLNVLYWMLNTGHMHGEHMQYFVIFKRTPQFTAHDHFSHLAQDITIGDCDFRVFSGAVN